MIFSKLIAARIAYGVDRAIAGSGAVWELNVAAHPTWFQYVTNYVQKGAAPPDLGSTARNNAFLAVMAVAKPGISPGQGVGPAPVASILIESTHSAVHTDSPFTITATCKDANGNTLSVHPTLHWLSSDPTKGTIVSATGVFTPVAAGVTNVTVHINQSGLQPLVTSNTDVVTLS